MEKVGEPKNRVIQIFATETLHKKLRIGAAINNIRMAEYVRQAIEEKFERDKETGLEKLAAE